MSFTLSTGNVAYPSASASITADRDDTADIRVTASCYLGDGWVQSTGVVAKIYFNESLFSTQTILGNGTYYEASATKSVSATDWFGKQKSNRTITWKVNFHQYTDGVDQGWRETVHGSVTISPITSHTVKYNANGGSGAPSSQTKWYGEILTLSSTKPTRTGYTFLGWATSSTGSVVYNSGAQYGYDSNVTLYAVWQEHALTVNYYSNYATSAFSGALNAVGSSKNVLVSTSQYYYDNSYSTYGLANYSGSSGSVYMTRTGYTPTGKWGTSTSGGTLVDEDTTFSTGQAIAEAFGKSLKTGNASINVYAQWTENTLTVNYYSNYATGAFSGAVNNVGADKNVIVRTYVYKYATAITNGLHNYSTVGDTTYLERTRYDATGYWGTELEGGILVHEDAEFANGQKLAEAFGLSLANKSQTINLYAQWVLLASRVTVYDANGNAHRGLAHIYDSNGVLHYAIITVYDSNGNARVVI